MTETVAKVVGLNDLNENEVTVLANDIEVLCFLNSCPYQIFVGEKHPVEFGVLLSDDVDIRKSDQSNIGVERLGSGYKYILRGRLHNDVIDCGFPVQDDVFIDEYKYLDGSFVELEIDRLNINFL